MAIIMSQKFLGKKEGMMDRRIDKVLWHEAQLIVSNEDGKIISIRILTSVDIMERIDDKTGKSILCLNAIVKERKGK